MSTQPDQPIITNAPPPLPSDAPALPSLPPLPTPLPPSTWDEQQQAALEAQTGAQQ
jgi:hypothetical protein